MELYYDFDSYTSFIVHTRRLIIQGYDKNNKLVDKLDTGDIGELDFDKMLSSQRSPKEYLLYDKDDLVSNLLFILEDLPDYISIMNKKWRKLKGPDEMSKNDDYILYQLDMFCIYYMTSYDMYRVIKRIVKSLDDSEISMDICSFWTDKDADDMVALPSLIKKQVPSPMEKHLAITQLYGDGFWFLTKVSIQKFDLMDFLIIINFYRNIAAQISYVVYQTVEPDVMTDIKNLLIIYKNHNPLKYTAILTDLELADDVLINSLISAPTAHHNLV
jgi:hypothetical protein